MTNQGEFEVIDILVIIQTITQIQNNNQMNDINKKLDILIEEAQNAHKENVR